MKNYLQFLPVFFGMSLRILAFLIFSFTTGLYLIAQDRANLVCGDLGTLQINGNTLTIQGFDVQNIGVIEAGRSTIGFYLSIDTDITRDDLKLGEIEVGILGSNQTQSVDFETSIAEIAPGSYFVGMVVDDGGTVPETSGEDNFCYYESPTVDISPEGEEKANLVCGDISDIVIFEDELTLNYSVSNSGEQIAGPSIVGFYLSVDQNISRSDVRIGGASIGALAPGQSTNFGFFSRPMEGLPDGLWYMGMIVDDAGTIDESSGEDNSCSVNFPQLGIGPEAQPWFVCQYFEEVLTVNESEIILDGLDICNVGNSYAPESSVGVFLSEDSEITLDDIFLGEKRLGGIPLGDIEICDGFYDFHLPLTGMPNGEYFVGIIMDYKNEVPNKLDIFGNSCYFDNQKVVITNSDIEEKPNLVCGEIGTLTVNGTNISLEDFEVKNTGLTSAGKSVVGYYLSEDVVIRRNDIRIGQDEIPALASNESVLLSFSTRISGIAEGSYYLGIIVDDTGVVPESSGEDNFCIHSSPKVEVLPPVEEEKANLVCGYVGDLEIGKGSFSLFAQLQNIGKDNAGPSTLGYYLSIDKTITRDDFRIGEDAAGSLKPGESEAFQFTRSFSGIPNGTYYVGIVVDDLGTVPESSGEDNFCAIDRPRLTIGPGAEPVLACQNLGSFRVEENTLNIDGVDICNIGSGFAETSVAGIFLSTDTIFSREDIFIGEKTISALSVAHPATCYSIRDLTLSIEGILEGEYYLGMILDYENEVFPPGSFNRTCFYQTPKVQISTQSGENKPNLTCGDQGTLTLSDEAFVIQGLEILNSGGAESNESILGFYLSPDENITPEDLKVGEFLVESLGLDEITEISFEADLSGIPNGSYVLGIILDTRGTLPESNEADNICIYEGIRIDVNNPDLAEQPNLTCSFSGNWVQGESSISFLAEISNIGNALAEEIVIGLYLSQDSLFSRDDLRIGEEIIDSLIIGAKKSVLLSTSTLNLPQGTFYLGIIIDDIEKIEESNEEDNSCFLSQSLRLPLASCKLDFSISLVEAANCLAPDGIAQIDLNTPSEELTVIWDNGENGIRAESLSAGIHTVQVIQSEGCQESRQFWVPSDSTSTDFQAEFSLDILGSTLRLINQNSEAENFEWEVNGISLSQEENPSLTLLGSGSYTICQTASNACASDTHCEIITLDMLESCGQDYSLISSAGTCEENSGSISILAPEQVQLTWVWLQEPSLNSQILDNLNPGIYSIEVLFEECLDTIFIELSNDNQNPIAGFEVSQSESTIQIINQSSNYDSLIWEINSQIFYEDEPEWMVEGNSIQEITLTLFNNCGSATISKTLVVNDQLTSIQGGIEVWRNWKIFPNPNSGVFRIKEFEWHEEYQIQILNSLGQVIHSGLYFPESGSIEINLGKEIAKGIYWTRIRSIQSNKSKIIKTQISIN